MTTGVAIADVGGETRASRIDRLAGGVLVLLGTSVMFGWWLQSEPLVRILSQYTPMVFNTALCFELTGAVLTTSALGGRSITLARAAAAAAVVMGSCLGLAQHIPRVDLGIDWPALHSAPGPPGLPPRPTSPGA